jgi:hypothetical protein
MRVLKPCGWMGLALMCVCLGGCELPYTTDYNSIAAAEDVRVAQRNPGDSLQLRAIAKKVHACMVEPNGAFDGSGAVGKVVDQRIQKLGAPHELPPGQADAAAAQAERLCTDNLIETAAISNPKGAAALAAVLLEQHYAVSASYSAVAKKDDAALASVQM